MTAKSIMVIGRACCSCSWVRCAFNSSTIRLSAWFHRSTAFSMVLRLTRMPSQVYAQMVSTTTSLPTSVGSVFRLVDTAMKSVLPPIHDPPRAATPFHRPAGNVPSGSSQVSKPKLTAAPTTVPSVPFRARATARKPNRAIERVSDGTTSNTSTRGNSTSLMNEL